MIIVNNTGPSQLVVHSIEIRDPLTGEVHPEFSQINSCVFASIRKGDHPCGITVTFAPALPFGKKNALLRIESNDPKKPAIHIKLSGIASPPKISVAPKSVQFGPIGVGSSSLPRKVTLKNTGISDLAIHAVAIEGTNAPEFIQTGNCTTEAIPQGGTCEIAITFSPTVPFGKKSASLNASTNDPKKPTVTVKLSGTAPPPKIIVSPMAINYGSVISGSTFTRTITVTNKGASDLVIDGIMMSGADASDFTQVNDCTAAPLKTADTCTITAAFTPVTPGKKGAMLMVTSNDPRKTAVNISLYGSAL